MSNYTHGSEELTEGQARYYTPTTEEVRNAFSLMDDDAATQENFQNFDRWLAKVKAEAWNEGVAAHRIYDYPENPYRGENK